MSERPAMGDLAVVLHSHMPYVEGFGTYPFGEEWLFDAVLRSYARVCPIAERLTFTVTPVLADQLEAAGVNERLLDFCRRFRAPRPPGRFGSFRRGSLTSSDRS